MNTGRSASAPTLSYDDARAIEDEVTKVFLEYLHTTGKRGEGIQAKQVAMYHPDIAGFGTGAQERFSNREGILALIQQQREEVPQEFTVDVDWVKVYPLDAVAAMAEGEMHLVVTLPEGPTLTMPCRASQLWVLQDGVWLMKHSHMSFPSSEQAEYEVFPVDALRARNQELERQVAERTAALESAKHEVEEALSNLKITQAQLIHQEKMASLGQLTAGIAHEIKNPLNFINNFAEVNEEIAQELREAVARGEDLTAVLDNLEQNARVINQHGRRADSIVQAMMQHASGGTGERESTDVNALVSEYIDLAYHGRRAEGEDLNVEIERDLGADVGTVEMVPQEIARVVLNLMGNAFDAVKGQPDAKVTVSTGQVDGQVEIRVADNGPGIPEEIREKIFEPFFTTKPTGTGTGLGLSLSYDIVTQGHGGTLTAESAEGQGATLIVTLPMKKTEADSNIH